eukprot:jgi/Mesen1/4154/ME000219S03280
MAATSLQAVTHVSAGFTSGSSSATESQRHRSSQPASFRFSRTSVATQEHVLSRTSSFTGTRLLAVAKPVAARSQSLRIEAAKRISSDRCFMLSTTLVAEEGKAEQVQKMCADLVKWAEEKKADKTSGIIHFECHADIYEGNVFHFTERYATFGTMNDIRASPDHCKFMDEVRPLLTGPVGLAAYEYKDGKIGHMLNPIGPKGEGGLDDATGQGGSGGGASYKQTSAGMQQGVGGGERDSWGVDQLLKSDAAKNAAKEATNIAAEAASRLAEGLKSLFGGKKK